MKSDLAVRPHGVRLLVLLAGVLGLGAAGAVALPASGEAQSPTATVAVKKEDRRVAYRERVDVRGALASGQPGRAVAVQYAPRGGGWQTVAETVSRSGGRYAAAVRPRQSGSVRVVADGGTSPTQRVAVAPRLSATAREHVRRGRLAVVRGVVRPGDAGRRVYIQLRDRGGWDTVDRVRTRANGRFKAVWRQHRPGRYAVRVLFRGDRMNAGGSDRVRGRLNVYRPSHASWYGPGLYGNGTACGGRLTPGTLGVAHRSLPCGTRVTFRHGGRSVTVRVIDRGPFAAGREWDLTAATKRKLGFGSTGTVWAAH